MTSSLRCLATAAVVGAAFVANPIDALAQEYAQPYAQPYQPYAQPYAQPAPPPPPPPQQPVMYVDPYGRPVQMQPAPQPTMYVDAYGNPIAPPAPAPSRPRVRQPARPRGSVGLSVHYLAFGQSNYRSTAALWGYHGFDTATTIAIDGGYHVLPYVMVGARAGYYTADGGAAAFDHMSLNLSVVDLGVIVRAGYPLALRGDWMFFPAVQLELGGANATTSLRNQTQSAIVPRFGANVILQIASPHVGLSVRVGYNTARWADAGGPGVDLELGGFTAGLGLDVRL